MIRHGKLVFERYFNGNDVSHANNVHSLSKSVLSVVTAIAISEGLLELDASIADVLAPDLVGTNGDLTIRNLLTMSGGLELREDEGEYDWEYTEKEGEPSMVRAVLERPRVAAPGEGFAFSTGLTQVLSAEITESAGGSSCDFAYDRLLAPLGIYVDYRHVHPDGYHAGGDSMFLTPREVARFGQLVLQRGAWEGQQLVPAELEIVPSLAMLHDYILPAVTDVLRQDRTSACDLWGGDIVGIRPDGSGRTVILDATSSIAPWSWSPDGTRIALHTNRDLNDEIYTMAADGSDPRLLLGQPVGAPSWSLKYPKYPTERPLLPSRRRHQPPRRCPRPRPQLRSTGRWSGTRHPRIRIPRRGRRRLVPLPPSRRWPATTIRHPG